MRLITDILRDIRKGRPVEEATTALADVVHAVDETGKEGSVTISRALRSTTFPAEFILIAAMYFLQKWWTSYR